VGIEIVQNDVQLSPWIVRHQFIHEIQKLPTSASGVMPGLHLPSGDIQCCK
jgi:hypothetical protein